MPTITANNCAMNYELDDFTAPWKPSETIWIQHGFGRNLRFWAHWVPLLGGKLRMLRRDMRGHGGSGDPGANHQWSAEELLQDMKGFLDAMGLERMHYLGESIGGTLGIAFAARWPERLKSLTLLATPTSIPPRVQKLFALGLRGLADRAGQAWLRRMGQGADGIRRRADRRRSGAHAMGYR